MMPNEASFPEASFLGRKLTFHYPQFTGEIIKAPWKSFLSVSEAERETGLTYRAFLRFQFCCYPLNHDHYMQGEH